MPRKRKIAAASVSATKPQHTEVRKYSQHEVELSKILAASQDNEANHEKYYKEMHKLYSKVGIRILITNYI